MQKIAAINECGLLIGQDHPKAKLLDRDVELMRQLAEQGMSYDELAQKFECSRHTVGRICRYERRAQTVAGFRKVHIPDE